MSTELTTRWPRLGREFSDLLEPFNELTRLNPWFADGGLFKTLTVPKVNITEDKDSYMLSLAAPGMTKKDFKIDLDGDLLTISAEKEESKEEKESTYNRKEYNYSSFSRTFTLPEEVLYDKLEATYQDGILKLMLPKNEHAAKKAHKTIPIK